MEARWPTDESLAGYVQLDRGAKKLRRDDVAIRVSRPGGLHCLLIGGGDLGRVLYEFVDVASLVAAAEETLVRTGPRQIGIALFYAYPNEHELWD